MAEDGHAKSIFPFFNLPRELRDVVYGHIATDPVQIGIYYPNSDDEDGEQHVRDETAIKMSLSNTLDLKVLCISRQIKREYEQIMFGQELLTFADHRGFEFDKDLHHRHFADRDRLKRIVKRAQYLGVFVCDSCRDGHCDAFFDAAEVKEWVRYALGYFPAITTIEVTLAMEWPFTGHPCLEPTIETSDLKRELDEIVAMRELDEIVAMQQVTALHVYQSSSTGFEVSEMGSRGPLLMRWIKQDGWQSSRAAA